MRKVVELKRADPAQVKAPESLGTSLGTLENGVDTSRPQWDAKSIALWILAVLAAIFMLRFAEAVLIPIVLAVLISFLLNRGVDWLERRLKCPRAIGSVIVLAVFLSAVGGTAYWLRNQAFAVIDNLPEAAQQLRTTMADLRLGRTTDALSQVQEAAAELEKAATEASGGPAPAAQRGVQRVQVEEPAFDIREYFWWGSMGLLAIASQFMLITFLVYFMLLSGDLYKRKLVKIAGPSLASKRITVQILAEIEMAIERFLAVQAASALLVAVATGFALWWLGLAQAPVWGILAGLFNSVPYIGPVIVSVGLMIVAFLQFQSISMALWIAGVALAITTLEGWLLTPARLGRAARMNSVAVFVSLVFWSWMWNVWGMLLAVPMMMVIKSVADRIEDLQAISELLGE